MKIQYFFKEIALFFLVFFIFVLPSINANQEVLHLENYFSLTKVTISFLVSLCALLVLFAQYKISLKKENIFIPKENFILVTIFTFLSICLVALFLQIISTKFNFKEKDISSFVISSKKEVFFSVLIFLCAAFTEESIFRVFFPECISNLLKNIFQKNKIIVSVSSELFSAVLFSLCHLYLGFFAVLNAFFSHFILRFCFIKTKSVFAGTISHAIYNLLNIFLIAKFIARS